MRTKSIMLLVLALGCGLVAAIGVTQVISQDSGAPKQTGETVKVLVAKKDISERCKITPELIKVEEWPIDRVPADAITDITKIEGMRARTEILVGEALRDKKLLSKGDFRTPTDSIDPSMRAVPIKIEKDSNAGLIRPGDRVDVLANIRKNTQEGILTSRTITLLQNVEIFAVNDVYRPNQDNDGGESITARTVTLVLTPKQSQKVDLAQQLGKLRIIMRGPNDETIVNDDKGIGTHDLLGGSEETPAPEVKQVATQTPTTFSTNETWKMRILTGSGVDDVVLEERDGNEGKKIWHVMDASSEPQSTAAMSPDPIDSSLIPPGLEPSE